MENPNRKPTDPPGWGLESGVITHSHKKTIITETQTRTINRDVTAPDGVVMNTNAQLDHHARQTVTSKPPTKLLAAKTSVKNGQWNVRTMYQVGNWHK